MNKILFGLQHRLLQRRKIRFAIHTNISNRIGVIKGASFIGETVILIESVAVKPSVSLILTATSYNRLGWGLGCCRLGVNADKTVD